MDVVYWRPIATADADSDDEVLLYGPDDAGDMRMWVGKPESTWLGPREVTPTHWRPLPDSPNELNTDDE